MSDKPVETPAAEAKPAEVTPEVAAEAAPAAETPAAAAPAAEEAKAAEPSAEPAAEPAAKPVAEPAAEPAAEPVAAVEKPKVTPIQALYAAAKEHGHPEIWGVTLADPETDVPSQIVFQKYLNANDGDLAKAKEQLISTLQWRAKTKPLELLAREYSSEKFAGLGYVTTYYASEAAAYDPAEPETKEVFTWNVYGNTKSIEKTFGDKEEFINWRVALMELALQDLSLATATKPITATFDPYKIFQVHDYKSISFLRQSPQVKAASTDTIKVFAQNYPELLKEKFFVNVPAIMGFVYSFMKLFVAAKTIKKFHPMSNGSGLAKEFADSKIDKLGEQLPKEYGGKAGELKTLGKEPKLQAVTEPAVEAKEEVAPAAVAEPTVEAQEKTAPVAATVADPVEVKA